MLGSFRRFTNSKVGVVVTFIVLGIIALAFAAGDITGLSQSGGGASGSTVATVAGRGIGEADFRERVRNEFTAFQQQQPTLDLATFVTQGGLEGTLERMIGSIALEAFGQAQGMIVSKKAVDTELASIPALQNPATGRFDQAIYENLLRQRRLTDAQIRRDIARDKIAQALVVPTIGASQVPQGLALPYASLLLERRSGQVGFVPAAAIGTGAAPTDAELQTFYQRNVARYTIPERRVIRYALVTPATVAAQATPSAQEILQAYNANRAKYAAAQTRNVTLVTVLDQNAANQLAAKVKAGGSLADAARAAGLEARTLTGVRKEALAQQAAPAVADAAFGAAQGAVVGPVRGSLGFVVARVDKIAEVAGKTLEQARGELVQQLTQQKSTDAIGRIHDALDDAIAEDASFNELAGDQKLTAVTTPPLTAAGINPEQPDASPDPALAPVIAAAFQAEDGDTAQLVQTGQDGSFALVGLERIVRAAPRPLAQVRADVARDFTAARARREARQVANAVMNKVNRGMPLAQALNEAGVRLPAPQSLDSSRAQLAANPQGAAPPLALMFAMAPGTAKTLEAPQQAGWYVVKLDRIVAGDARNQPGVIAATRADLGRNVGREYVEQFTKAVQRDVGVTRNAAAIATARRELLGQGQADN